MSDSPQPTRPRRPTTQSGGINVGDLTSERGVNVTLDHVAGRDQIINSPGTQIINEAPRRLSAKERLAQRNRQTMIHLVRKFWIEGVLNNSLHSKIIPLDMERSPGAVTRPRPWDVLWQHKGEEAQPLPSVTKLIDLFHQDAGDALLILGEPGSGKTTMLLELAHDLLDQAEQDEALRIPIVFNLSSWALKRPPLIEWLAAELNSIYQIPPKVAEAWVKKDEILPLLDGLDEVAQAQRVACIEAINTYRAEHGLTPMVVCSRIADYEAVGTKLTLSDALILRPLTKAQVDEFLAVAGRVLDGLREAMVQDEVLREMAQSPLMLSIMALTYRNQTPEQLLIGDFEERRRQLFATYTTRMVSQRRRIEDDKAAPLHHLTWMAYQMTEREQVIFFLEDLQPNSLPEIKSQHYYYWQFRLLFGLTFGLVFGLVFGPVFGLMFGLVFGLVSQLEDLNSLGKIMTKTYDSDYSTGNLRFRLVSGLTLGLVLGLFVGQFAGLAIGLAVGLFVGLAVGLFVGAITRMTPKERTKNSIYLVGILLGKMIFRLAFGLAIGLVGGLIGQLTDGQTVGLIDGLALGLVSELAIGLVGGPVIGLFLGLVGGIFLGEGIAEIQYYTLRFWLYRYNRLPMKAIPFLDRAADQLILQKVGGGYRFVHRLLQEYLASLYTEEGGGH